MGCLHSKKEVSELHPNVYHVVNVDETGRELCSGQLAITDTELILDREGRESTVWPLNSLRRYGFEGEIFSFESGRRCETGEGIYAFRCRRASVLFRTLKQHIMSRNVIHDSVPYPGGRPARTPPPVNRQTLQASVIHRSSIINNVHTDNGSPVAITNNITTNANHTGVPRNVSQSPRSPSSADILEVMPLYPRSQTSSNQVTNVYQVRDLKKEHNNNQDEAVAEARHVYSNELSRDLAVLRNTLHQETVLRDIEDETRFLESRYLNEHVGFNQATPLSPTLSNSSEHYALLNVEQESARLYMNIVLSDANTDLNKNEGPPSTPLTPKLVEYCNLSIGSKSEINTYANFSIGQIGDSKNVKKLYFTAPNEHSQKFSESDTFPSLSPVEESEVNYAVLDIDANKDAFKASGEFASPESLSYNSLRNESTASCTSQPRGRLVSQSSVEYTPPVSASAPAPAAAPAAAAAAAFSAAPAPAPAPGNIGYTTIDFDKTVALTSVAARADSDVDGPRKTRHDSTHVLCNSPNSIDKPKLSFS